MDAKKMEETSANKKPKNKMPRQPLPETQKTTDKYSSCRRLAVQTPNNKYLDKHRELDHRQMEIIYIAAFNY